MVPSGIIIIIIILALPAQAGQWAARGAFHASF
jgi:hypothetical protein